MDMIPTTDCWETTDDALTYAFDIDKIAVMYDRERQLIALRTEVVYTIGARALTYMIHVACNDATLTMWIQNAECNYRKKRVV